MAAGSSLPQPGVEILGIKHTENHAPGNMQCLNFYIWTPGIVNPGRKERTAHHADAKAQCRL